MVADSGGMIGRWGKKFSHGDDAAELASVILMEIFNLSTINISVSMMTAAK
jgi:hypothetical protein